MEHRDTFSDYHPLVNFAFFALVIGFAMFVMHPAFLLVSLASAWLYHLRLRGRSSALKAAAGMVPFVLVATVINLLFNHEGATILLYLPTGNPLTLESIVYGAAAASMLLSVILWFACFNAVITSDKFVYLFGRIIPALGLVLSMTLRFVPRFRTQLGIFRQTRQAMYRDAVDRNLLAKIRSGITVVSMLVTWSLENAVETADSMKSRGYGLKGRSSFSVYSLDKRDGAALLWLLICGVFVMVGWCFDAFYWSYFPVVQGGRVDVFLFVSLVFYAALTLTPTVLGVKEGRKWKYIQSRI